MVARLIFLVGPSFFIDFLRDEESKVSSRDLFDEGRGLCIEILEDLF